jgi:RNA polymerase sigma-70 factor (ECF subfamily)
LGTLRGVTGSDARLGARLVQGDEGALRDVYRQYAGAVCGLAMRVLNNRALAEEVTQDVFVHVWERPDRFDPGRGSLRAYLLAMTHSRAVERVRAEDSLRRRHEAAGREPAVAGEQDPAQIVGRSQARNAVQGALRELPDDQRVAIEMAYFEGLSYRAVACALGEPEGTVKYRIRTGMQTMRAALQAVEVSP